MIGWWRRQGGIRRAVGVIAGQLFVVQLLLAGVVATEMAVADAIGIPTICSSSVAPTGDGSDHSNTPIHHVTCSICTFASLSGPLPEPDVVAILRTSLDVGSGSDSISTIREADRFEPRSSQGPPQAA
ncbi:hypothetical protein SR870_07020 [Rhodopseudomonas palustris]|uniref:hypothetical protein n=1 Tax=Rhodopseudomonas palustris TaxID=1076 RepID=UPI002ACD4960|nr:hypothetical protein [Rhodopseudomonas palustris]WQH01019.1 hypothetical protein SR870_07020 [Rhodopseudomonas palustris]